MSIGENIRNLRNDHDDTQDTLAKVMGCSRKQIGRYESGEQEMTTSKLKALCLYYHVSADYILDNPNFLIWPRIK